MVLIASQGCHEKLRMDYSFLNTFRFLSEPYRKAVRNVKKIISAITYIKNIGLFPKYDLDIKCWLLQHIYFQHPASRVEIRIPATGEWVIPGSQLIKQTDRNLHNMRTLSKENLKGNQ